MRSASLSSLLLVIAAWLACACATQPTTVPRPASLLPDDFGYPRDLCHARRNRGVDLDASLTAIKDLLGRGCPRQAEQLAGELSDEVPRDSARAARFRLLALEIEVARELRGLHGFQQNLMPEFDADIQEYVADHLAFMDGFEQLSRDLEQFAGLDYVHRLVAILQQKVSSVCVPQSLLENEGRAKELYDAIVGDHIDELQPASFANAREHARQALYTCDPGRAVAYFDDAAERAQSTGHEQVALEMRVRALEAELFVGGHAEALELLPGVDQRLALAGQLLAAERDKGPLAERARRVEFGLDELGDALPGAARKPASASMISRIRAAARLGLAHDLPRSIEASLAAIELAEEAGRADLVDAAGFMLVVALAEAGDSSTFRVAEELARSLTDRGLEGAVQFVGQTLLDRALLMSAMGRGPSALALLNALTTFAGSRHPFWMLQSLRARAELLLDAGRFEEAIEISDAIMVELDARHGQLSAEFVSHFQTVALILYGRAVVHVGFDSDFDAFRVHPDRVNRIIERGDPAEIAILFEGTFPAGAATSLDLQLFAVGRCRAARELGVRAAYELLRISVRTQVAIENAMSNASSEVLDGFQRDLYADADQQLLASMHANTLVNCGAILGDPELVEVGVVLMRYGAPSRFDDAWLKTLTPADLEASGDHARAAAIYLDAARERLEDSIVDFPGPGSFQTATLPYERAVASAAKAGEPRLLVTALEESRSRDLVVMRSNSSRASEGTLTELSRIEAEIASAQATIRRYRSLLDAAEDAAVHDELSRAIDELEASVRRSQGEREGEHQRLASTNASSYRAAALGPVPTLAQIQAELGADEILVYFIVQLEEAWALIIQRGRAQIVPLPSPGTLGIPRLDFVLKERRRLNARLSSRGRGVLRGSAGEQAEIRTQLAALRTELYELLVEPWESLVAPDRRVLIVPDKATSDLPFAALGPLDRPWITRNPIRVVPNAALLATPPSSGKRIVVMGDPTLGDFSPAPQRGSQSVLNAANVQWGTLPGSRAEAKAVADIYRTRAALGRRATEARLRKLAPKARVLHLASHGIAFPARPDESALIMSVARLGELDDGILQAFEIQRMRLPGTLVVLSACETGHGQMRGNEGMLALDRAFMIAGAGVVVSSLWRVDDDATAALMVRMHEELVRGQPVDVALARAMRAVRESPDHADPWFWSGFRVVGGGWR